MNPTASVLASGPDSLPSLSLHCLVVRRGNNKLYVMVFSGALNGLPSGLDSMLPMQGA